MASRMKCCRSGDALLFGANGCVLRQVSGKTDRSTSRLLRPNGTSLPKAEELARHSDVKVTMKYARNVRTVLAKGTGAYTEHMRLSPFPACGIYRERLGLNVMSELDLFVGDIESRLSGALETQTADTRGTQAIEALDVGGLSKKFAMLLGSSQVDAFFSGYEPTSVDGSFQLFTILWQLISFSVRASPEGRMTLDSQLLLEDLTRLANAIQSGTLEYTITLRLTNIDLAAEFEIAPDVRLHKLSVDAFVAKYALKQEQIPVPAVPPSIGAYWTKHRVEAVITGSGTAAELQALSNVAPLDQVANSLLEPFLLAEIPVLRPAVTHIYIESPIGLWAHQGSSNGYFVSEPHLLSQDEIARLKDMYQFLANDVPQDRVLERAVDRFILGRKSGIHHPNRVNQPNWDKIVDYVMALETLFLTAKDGNRNQELAYRFRLNGSSIIGRASGADVHRTFHALNALYNLRSAVVHGSDEKRVIDAANDFVARARIDRADYQHSLGRLLLICECLEEWIRKTFHYLRGVSKFERPYNRKDGWEEMLWQTEGPPPVVG